MDRLRWLYRAWRYRLLLERQEVRALRRHLTAGDTAIDIGAHKGAFTYWMLRRVGRDGLVLAFEPQRPLAVALRELVCAEGSHNVVVEQIGLSSRSGTMSLMAPLSGTSPSASLEPGPDDIESPGAVPVEVDTLDDYLRKREVGVVHFYQVRRGGP